MKRTWFQAMPVGFRIRTTLPYRLDSEEVSVQPGCRESLGMWVMFLKKGHYDGHAFFPYHISQLGAIFPGP